MCVCVTGDDIQRQKKYEHTNEHTHGVFAKYGLAFSDPEVGGAVERVQILCLCGGDGVGDDCGGGGVGDGDDCGGDGDDCGGGGDAAVMVLEMLMAAMVLIT